MKIRKGNQSHFYISVVTVVKMVKCDEMWLQYILIVFPAISFLKLTLVILSIHISLKKAGGR